MVDKNPSLVSARITQMSPLIPDGYTLLLLACSKGNLPLARSLLSSYPHCLPQKTLTGLTALHLGAPHRPIVDHLLTLMTDPPPLGPNAPVDLSGVTPAQAAWDAGQKDLARDLLRDGDYAVLPFLQGDRSYSGGCGHGGEEGEPKPRWRAGRSEVKGFRKRMEDAVSFGDRGSYVAVFDGHGGDDVSAYLRDADMGGPWPLIDAGTRGMEGGSTAVVVRVDEGECWNVGDSGAYALRGVDKGWVDLAPPGENKGGGGGGR